MIAQFVGLFHDQAFDFDAIFVQTYAPGRSAYNEVEHAMSVLSRELASIILRHEAFGSHLDASGTSDVMILAFPTFFCLLKLVRNTVVVALFTPVASPGA